MPKWKRGEKGIGWQKRRTEDNHNYPAVDTKAVESLLAQLAGAEAGWMDDPAFIRWLAKAQRTGVRRTPKRRICDFEGVAGKVGEEKETPKLKVS